MNFNQFNQNDCLFFYNLVMQICNINDLVESTIDIDFPNKNELGGVVLQFKGGGVAYFKIQKEMPTDNEIFSIYEVGKFLSKIYGQYIVLRILCLPHIEISNIEITDDDKFSIEFFSARKNDGDEVLKMLSEKLENKEEFGVNEHILRMILPFMSRNDNEQFKEKYSKFLSDYNESGLKTPDVADLKESSIFYGRFF